MIEIKVFRVRKITIRLVRVWSNDSIVLSSRDLLESSLKT